MSIATSADFVLPLQLYEKMAALSGTFLGLPKEYYYVGREGC
jgi:hypothetical protein